MIGYKYTTIQEAIDARSKAAVYMGLPNPQKDTLYWVNFQFSIVDGFYYIQHIEGLDAVLGEPINFNITYEELN